MTQQLTVQQLEKIAEALPRTEGATWSVKQVVGAVVTVNTVASSIGPVRIISPGDHFVGIYIDHMTYRPNAQTSYWYIKQMAEAGWQEDGLLND